MSRTTLSERGDARMADDGGQNTGATDGLRRALPWVASAVAAGAGALLAVGAFLGLYVRPTSDDWCALWKARDMGVLGITADFYQTQNGRVTNAFLTGLLYSDGMRGPKLLPAFLVVALVTGLFLLGRAALRSLRSLREAGRPDGAPSDLPARPPALPLVAAAALLSALRFFAGTRSYQVLLWAPATISHTLPSVIGQGGRRSASRERTGVRIPSTGPRRSRASIMPTTRRSCSSLASVMSRSNSGSEARVVISLPPATAPPWHANRGRPFPSASPPEC